MDRRTAPPREETREGNLVERSDGYGPSRRPGGVERLEARLNLLPETAEIAGNAGQTVVAIVRGARRFTSDCL